MKKASSKDSSDFGSTWTVETSLSEKLGHLQNGKQFNAGQITSLTLTDQISLEKRPHFFFRSLKWVNVKHIVAR